MSCIAGYHGQWVNHCRGGNLFVQRIFRMWSPQTAPDLSRLLVKRKNGIGVLNRKAFQPTLETLCLSTVTTVADQFDTLPKLTDGDCRQE